MSEEPRPVKLVDLDVSMGDLAGFILKVAVAAIPTLFVFGIVGAIFWHSCSGITGR